MSDYDMEDRKQAMQLQFTLLKGILQETGLIIGFDKTNNNFVFMDRKKYIQGKTEGFKISLDELTY